MNLLLMIGIFRAILLKRLPQHFTNLFKTELILIRVLHDWAQSPFSIVLHPHLDLSFRQADLRRELIPLKSLRIRVVNIV